MDVNEFSVEFDILLNQRFSTTGINYFDEYEKSILLTKAQESIVEDYYRIFESSEKARRALAPIVRTGAVSYDSSFNTTYDSLKIDSTSKLFKIASEVRYILSEQIIDSSGNRYSIKPTTHDDYESDRKNPFRQSTSSKSWNRALRLDLSYSAGTEQIIEVVYPTSITSYKFRYLKYPKPIILNDVFPDEKFDEYYYDIRELSTATTSELDVSVHPEIINRAVGLAINALNINNK